jgi:hypothetical protein
MAMNMAYYKLVFDQALDSFLTISHGAAYVKADTDQSHRRNSRFIHRELALHDPIDDHQLLDLTTNDLVRCETGLLAATSNNFVALTSLVAGFSRGPAEDRVDGGAKALGATQVGHVMRIAPESRTLVGQRT